MLRGYCRVCLACYECFVGSLWEGEVNEMSIVIKVVFLVFCLVIKIMQISIVLELRIAGKLQFECRCLGVWTCVFV